MLKLGFRPSLIFAIKVFQINGLTGSRCRRTPFRTRQIWTTHLNDFFTLVFAWFCPQYQNKPFHRGGRQNAPWVVELPLIWMGFHSCGLRNHCVGWGTLKLLWLGTANFPQFVVCWTLLGWCPLRGWRISGEGLFACHEDLPASNTGWWSWGSWRGSHQWVAPCITNTWNTGSIHPWKLRFPNAPPPCWVISIFLKNAYGSVLPQCHSVVPFPHCMVFLKNVDFFCSRNVSI